MRDPIMYMSVYLISSHLRTSQSSPMALVAPSCLLKDSTMQAPVNISVCNECGVVFAA
jgi:hypothetical protein